jgi:hypothetical protein
MGLLAKVSSERAQDFVETSQNFVIGKFDNFVIENPKRTAPCA